MSTMNSYSFINPINEKSTKTLYDFVVSIIDAEIVQTPCFSFKLKLTA